MKKNNLNNIYFYQNQFTMTKYKSGSRGPAYAAKSL